MSQSDSFTDSRIDPEIHSHLMHPDEIHKHEATLDRDDCPIIDASFVEWMERQYPQQPYTSVQTLGDVMYEEGKRAIITAIRTLHNNQQEEQGRQ